MGIDKVKKHPKLAFTLMVITAAVVVVSISCSASAVVNAQVVIKDACKQAAQTDAFDLTVTGTERRGDTSFSSVVKIRMNGSDMHQINYDENGNAGYEVIIVDGITYYREADQQWNWGSWITWVPPTFVSDSSPGSDEGSGEGPVGQVNEQDTGVATPVPDSSPGSGENSGEGPVGQVNEQGAGVATFCGIWDLTDVDYLGTARVGEDDTEVDHFSILMDQPEYGEGGGNYQNWELWIDSSSRILQAQGEGFRPAGAGFSEEHVEVLMTFSGHGEPNVITAPDITIP